MKKLLLITILTVALSACNKSNQCNTCTVITTNSVSGESTKVYTESDSGDCEMSLDEYKGEIDVEADLRDINAELQDFFGSTTQTHTISCTQD